VKNDDDEEEFADDEQFGLPDKFLFLFLWLCAGDYRQLQEMKRVAALHTMAAETSIREEAVVEAETVRESEI
jgi:hypothetical protein